MSSDKNEMRKQIFAQMEEMLKDCKPEDSSFYYHSSEDRIVLSHALFWVMTQNIKGKMTKQKFFMLLRQYQEEMLEAYLNFITRLQRLATLLQCPLRYATQYPYE